MKNIFKIIIYMFMTICCFALPSLKASAEHVNEIKEGYFYQPVIVYTLPDINSEQLLKLKHHYPYRISIVDKYFGKIDTGEVEGYVRYNDFIPFPEFKAIDEKPVFFEKTRRLYEFPVDRGNIIRKLLPEEEVMLLGRRIGYAKVRDKYGNVGYVQSVGIMELMEDIKINAAQFYAEYPLPLLSKPLLTAEPIGNIKANIIYDVVKRNREYAYISINRIGGYVPFSDLIRFDNSQNRALCGYNLQDIPCYNSPDLKDLMEKPVERFSLLFLSEKDNNFYFDKLNNRYILKKDITAFNVNMLKSSYVNAHEEAELYLDPECSIALGIIQKQNTILGLTGETARAYLVKYKDRFAFAKLEQWSWLKDQEKMDLSYAVLNKNISIADIESQIYENFSQGTALMLVAKMAEYYIGKIENKLYYIPMEAANILGSDVPIVEFETKTDRAIMLYAYPDSSINYGKWAIREGTKLKISGFNGDYVCVSTRDKKGYMLIKHFNNPELELVPKTQKRYMLKLNKSSAVLRAYEIDEKGNLTNNIAVEAAVAIGKRTTPSPTGSFVLGAKERWHKWTFNYSPYTINYTQGRYIHGLLYSEKKLSAMVEGSDQYFGMEITGGCLRSPTELAQWIYYNCPSYTTELEITED